MAVPLARNVTLKLLLQYIARRIGSDVENKAARGRPAVCPKLRRLLSERAGRRKSASQSTGKRRGEIAGLSARKESRCERLSMKRRRDEPTLRMNEQNESEAGMRT